LDVDAYPFTVRKLAAEDGGGYLVEYPDVPLCQSDGETIEEAIANGREALEGSLMCYLEDGKPLPKPSSGRAYSGTFRVRMSKTMHAQIAARAKEEGVSLNLFLVEAAAEAVGRRVENGGGKRETQASGENRKVAMRRKRAKRVA
jgi:antitoxin HicB